MSEPCHAAPSAGDIIHPSPQALLAVWGKDIRRIYRAHYLSAARRERGNLWLGGVTVVLSAIVGTSVFASLGSQPDFYLKITIGMVSVCVTVLAALQTFLRSAEKAEQHRAAGARFAALYREARCMLVFDCKTQDALCNEMNRFREKWDLVSESCPLADASAWRSAMENVPEDTEPVLGI